MSEEDSSVGDYNSEDSFIDDKLIEEESEEEKPKKRGV